MSSITRRQFIAAATAVSAGSMAGLSQRASAAEFSFKYAHNVPATHPMTVRMQEAAAKILEESGGKVEIRLGQIHAQHPVAHQSRSCNNYS